MLDVEQIDADVELFLTDVGEVFAEFRQQDSGCQALGLRVEQDRWFVKFSVEQHAVPSLRRAAALHREVEHPSVIPLRNVISLRNVSGSRSGLALVYPWVDGEVLYGAPGGGATQRLDAAGAHARFRALPVEEILASLDAVYDAHVAVAASGFVAADLYDGCLIYDFPARRTWLCDLDEYRRGPFVLDQDRLPGSTRFMAPEEFRHGATIDQRTTVFNLGRAAQVLLDEGDLQGRFRGGAVLAAVAAQATERDPAGRYPSVAEFVDAWRSAAGS
ncbi:MAG: hypothetical protein ACR2JK_13315 [Geodermatophilaceae bacterium]